MSDDGALLDLVSTDDGLRLIGEIDAASSVELASRLDPLPGHTPRVELDLGSISFIDSSGLRVLIDAHLRAQNEGRRLVIVTPSPSVRRLLEISGLTDYLHVE